MTSEMDDKSSMMTEKRKKGANESSVPRSGDKSKSYHLYNKQLISQMQKNRKSEWLDDILTAEEEEWDYFSLKAASDRDC